MAEVLDGIYLEAPAGLAAGEVFVYRSCNMRHVSQIRSFVRSEVDFRYFNQWDSRQLAALDSEEAAVLAEAAAELDPAWQTFAEAQRFRADDSAQVLRDGFRQAPLDAFDEPLSIVSDACEAVGQHPPSALVDAAYEYVFSLGVASAARGAWEACNDLFYGSDRDGFKYYDGMAFDVGQCDGFAGEVLEELGGAAADQSDVYEEVVERFLDEVVGGPLCVGTDCSTVGDPRG